MANYVSFSAKFSYSQTVPSRFVKEVVKYADENKDGVIQQSEFQHFLDNIGAGDKLSKDEIQDVMNYVGGEDATELSIETVQKKLIDEIIAKRKK
eukprot:scaffold1323_cov113-Cylindrotheca_fusiformis.AAC.12